jgi:starvation-inducible DNA-binding protein
MSNLIPTMKTVLGSVFGLYLKTHIAHWNIEGIHFPSIHAFFGDLYTEIWSSVDDIAEQIRQLDAYTPMSMQRLAELSRIESFDEPLPARDMVLALLADQITIIALLTQAMHEAEAEDKQGLVNFLAGRIEVHSKQRWQLRATAKVLRE